MSDTDFYNRNLYRNYPFVDYPPYVLHADTPRRAVADVGVVFLSGSGFDPSNEDHKIYWKAAGLLAIGLIVVAPGAAVDGAEFGAATLTPSKYGVEPFTLTVDGSPMAYGFVVLGDMSGLPLLPLPVTVVSTTPFLERRCIQVIEGHYVRSLNIANEPRTIADDKCEYLRSSSSSDGSSPLPIDYRYAPGGQNIVGDVRFEEGFNTDINVIANANAIRFSARRGAGLGEACEEVPRTAAEQIRFDGGLPLDRAVRCDEVFSNVNGVSPDSSGNFSISARRGVEVTSPSPHRILIAGRDDLEDCTP